MKVISIIQPWATLIAIGEKRFETRSWSTKHRGELAIHASKRVAKSICKQEPFKSVLAKHGYTADNLPTGAIIGTVNLVDSIKVVSDLFMFDTALLDNEHRISGNEYKFGDYNTGRYAWELTDVKQIDPIPAKGQLNLWEYNLT